MPKNRVWSLFSSPITYHNIIMFMCEIGVLLDLNEFMNRLDKWYNQTLLREGGTTVKKVQRNGALSTKSPPRDAPKWTTDTGLSQWADIYDCDLV